MNTAPSLVPPADSDPTVSTSAFATMAPSATRWTDGASVLLVSPAHGASSNVLRAFLDRTALRLVTVHQRTTFATLLMGVCALSLMKVGWHIMDQQ